jgi:muramoyltetrapeptide carboxypeptidase
MGESDATALGCWALCAGVSWLHGPMIATQLRGGAGSYDESSLRSALSGDPYELKGAGVSVLAPGYSEGTLWGGCLTLLAALCGTPWLPRLDRSVLVIEDVSVKPYQVHRMLVQLRDAGALEGLVGVVLGDFSACVQHENQGYDIHAVLADFVRSAAGDVPVTSGWPIGHSSDPHVTLAMGWRAVLDAGTAGATLSLSPKP